MPNVEATLRVVIVEDDDRLRREMETVLGAARPCIDVARTFSTLQAATEGVNDATLEIDVALVDLRLSDGSGLEVIRELRRTRPRACAVAVTMFDDPATVLASIRAGARGYILKGWTSAQLVACVRDAASGGAPLSPRIARYVLDAVRTPPYEVAAPSLTEREREVLALLCEGRTYREVALALTIGIGTVQTHVKSIYAKLEVESKAELATAAFRRGLVR